MSDEPRVLELLADMLDSGATPEEACRSCPELLAEVRERWREVCQARSELDVLFPPFQRPNAAEGARPGGTPLPKIAGYEVEAVIGQGGMGVAFRARHLGLNRVVALKMMLAGEYAGPQERERFRREAEAVAGLRHPNIVQVHDVGDSHGRPFFTMEYVEGGSLARRLDGKPQPPREAAALLATLAGAVHAAHRGGIVHRDLKPSNVLLTAEGAPKISDFGLARRLDSGASLTRTGAALGTPSYMAPEQAAGKRNAVKPAVDIYALGAVLYELLTGRPPFRAETAAETVQQVLSCDPVPPSRLNTKVPRDLEIVCLKCLRKEPALRYASASALGDDLDRFLRGEAIAARPEGRLERLTRRVRQRPALSAALSLGTVITVVTIGFGLWLLSERATITRKMESDQAAAERAADENLCEMVRLMKSSSWTEARAALDRAKAWLGNHPSDDLRSRVVQGERDLELVRRLDEIRLKGYTHVENRFDFTRADEQYAAALLDAGIGQVGDPLEMVAARVNSSHVKNALLAALDHWSVCVPDARRPWLTALTEHPSLDSGGWRARIHATDPGIWKDEQALYRLITAAPAPEQSAAVLLAFEMSTTFAHDNHLRFLERLHEVHPRDFWVNLRIATVYAMNDRPAEAIGYYQAAAAIRPDESMVHYNLGMVFQHTGHVREALARFREAVRLEPNSATNRFGFANMLSFTGRHGEAIEQAQEAIRLGGDGVDIRLILGRSLEAQNRRSEAIDSLRRAASIGPKERLALYDFRGLFLRLGMADELLDAWAASIATDPAKHDDWYGYAELCLFHGREEAYIAARRSLLAKFGTATQQNVMERTARTCLLRPASGDDLTRSAALSARVAAIDRSSAPNTYHAFQFVKGLAEYRQGRYAEAIATMEGDASRAMGPAPRLVIAMAQQRSGRAADARKTLAMSVSGHDWRADQVHDQDDWIIHVLRREAEALVLPDLPTLLDGTRQPRDNDERLAMLGGYLFASRFHDAAQLYADAFTADPNLVRDLATGHRFNAARVATLAGCGRGTNGANIGEPERKRLRAQARQWLRGELDSCRSAIERDPLGRRDGVRMVLNRCREAPDLGGLREPSELEKLPPDERDECLRLWDEVKVLIDRVDGRK